MTDSGASPLRAAQISVMSPLLPGPVEVKVLLPPGLELDAEALEFLRARCEAAVYDSWCDFLDKLATEGTE